MNLIVGLGNPGEQYTYTRHNIGFRILDALKQERAAEQNWQSDKKFQAQILQLPNLILCKPQTFMNSSGTAVAAIQRMYKIDIADIWVVHDEVDLEKGKLKIQIAGGSAGHNGIKSVIEKLGSPDFIRWRVGVGKPLDKIQQETADYVLEKFTEQEEKEFVAQTITRTVESLQFALSHDLLATMNKYN